MRMYFRLVLSAFLLLALPLTGSAEPGVAVSGKILLDDLRRGGYVVYFRHTKTLPEHEHEAKMRREGKWSVDDCTTQRNLSEIGILEARQQRDWLARFGIPHDKVYSSRACRAKIHAQWVAGKNPEFLDVLTPSRSREKGIALRKMLNTAPAAGTNTLMFAHGGVLWNATDYDSEESETFVFRPAVDGKPPILVASIKMTDWEALARGESCCAPRAYWRGSGEPPTE